MTIELPLRDRYGELLAVALVDDVDADLAAMTWRLESFGYAVANVQWAHHRLHRVVLARVIGRELTRGEQADHINLDTLDNRRANLRLATSAENARNQGVRPDSKNGFRGVRLNTNPHRVTKRWEARVNVGGAWVYCGYFRTASEAAHAYDGAARRAHGKFARLNFPRSGEQGAHVKRRRDFRNWRRKRFAAGLLDRVFGGQS